MEKLVIKVTFNSKNPIEAELIEILKKKKNRAAHLKMAALYFWEILEPQIARERGKTQETRVQSLESRVLSPESTRVKSQESEYTMEIENRKNKTDDIDLGNTFTEWK